MQERVVHAFDLPWDITYGIVEAFCEGVLCRAVPHGSPTITESSPRGEEGRQFAAFVVEGYLVVPGVGVGDCLERVFGHAGDEVEGGRVWGVSRKQA